MSKANEALDKMAENARQVGLDYEPSSVSKLAREAGIRDCTCNGALGCLERFASLVRADERSQRTWVGLTDEEVRKVNQEVWGYVSADHARMRGYARAIEAKLKEKNNGN